WEDVEHLGQDFRLMFDLVLNHCSRRSGWFRDFVIGIAPASHYFLPVDPGTDLSEVVRPRSLPLLTKTATRAGEQWVWTTFSSDQVDLNWANPDVLFEFLDILFLYLSKGAEILRMDAVAFLWKRIGTPCLHLPETHEVVKLLRDVMDIVAPSAVLLTETNVPHEENLSYFGQGDEAHMVYNFALPPLLLHALLRHDGSLLTHWAASLPDLGNDRTFLNFTASHDGIGLRPLQGLVDDEERDWVIEEVSRRGGRVSTRAMQDGSNQPYELNITWRDAMDEPGDPELGLARFLCSQAILLAFKGVPALYIHSLLGTPNDHERMIKTGHSRSINRHQWDYPKLNTVLDDPETPQARAFNRITEIIGIRARQPAFHPNATQFTLQLGDKIFGFWRQSLDRDQSIFAIHNMTKEEVSIPAMSINLITGSKWSDLLSGEAIDPARGDIT
ncbi:MAG: alpha-amylase, partial [Verrucomicrobiae bacterium]|nr:alpha-amylase [Verrucomicrobiae bacterium]